MCGDNILRNLNKYDKAIFSDFISVLSCTIVCVIIVLYDGSTSEYIVNPCYYVYAIIQDILDYIVT